LIAASKKVEDNPIKTNAFDISLERIINHSELALNAVGELNFSILNLNRLSKQSSRYQVFHKQVFNSINTFLSHTCTICCILWPEIGKKDESGNHSANQITRNVKKSLGHASRQLLKNKILRDIFPHHENFDLTNFEIFNEYETMVDSANLAAYSSPDKKIRYYNPMSRDYYVDGKTLNIQDTAAVIFKVLFYAREELQKQRALTRVELYANEQFSRRNRFGLHEAAVSS